MNQKAYSVLFCALLASTFVHELRAKGVAPVSSRLGVFERAASDEVCELECSFSGNVSLSFGITIEVVQNVLVIANYSANVALLIDVSTQIIVVLNGTSGAGVAIDLSAQTGVYVKSGLWVAANGSLAAYIQSLSGGLKAIFNVSGAVSFKLSSVSSAILEVINSIIVKLVLNISVELQQNAKLGLQILLSIGGGLVVLLRGSLDGLLLLIGSTAIQISTDIAGLLNLLQGFASVVVKVAGSLSAAISAGVHFDLAIILGAQDGLQALINIILAIGANADLSSALCGLLNDAEAFFKLVAQLGGNSSYGISGVFNVVANIVGLINGKVNLEVVIGSIIQYVAYSSERIESDLSGAINATLEGLLAAIERVNLAGELRAVVKIVRSLIAGTLVIGGVAISVIIRLLAGVAIGVSNLLNIVVAIIIQLNAVVQQSVSLPYLLLVLIIKLNSSIGVGQLIALGIKINIDLARGAGGILGSILSGAVSLVLRLLTGQFYNALAGLPVIGTIIEALNAAISAATNGQITLKGVLNVNTLVKNLILALIQLTTGIRLGASSSNVASAKAILESTSSVSATIGVNITVSGSGSFSG